MSHRANILLLEMLVNRGMKVVDFDQFYKVSLVKVNKNSRRQTKIMKADRRFYPPSLIKKEQKPEVQQQELKNTHAPGPIKSVNGYIIMEKSILPYIFQFNLKCTRLMRVPEETDLPKIGKHIFNFVMNYASTYRIDNTYNTRMKNQEKIKFLLRAFEHRYAICHKIPPKRVRNFTLAGVKQFFQRPEVRQCFLRMAFEGLKQKKQHNDKLKVELENHIVSCLRFDDTEQEQDKAYLIFKSSIKNRQLPWYSQMYMDLLEFSRKLYLRYADVSETEKQRVKALPIGSNNAWESAQTAHSKQKELSQGQKY